MSLHSFIDRLNGGSEKAEEDRKILLYKKWVSYGRPSLDSNRYPNPDAGDIRQGKMLAIKRAKEDALAEKIIQVEPRLWPSQNLWSSHMSTETRHDLLLRNLIGDIDEKLVARMNDANADREEMKNLIGDIDEKLVARMNDANAEREEMKASINSIQERMKISERILQKVINFIISSNS